MSEPSEAARNTAKVLIAAGVSIIKTNWHTNIPSAGPTAYNITFPPDMKPTEDVIAGIIDAALRAERNKTREECALLLVEQSKLHQAVAAAVLKINADMIRTTIELEK